MQPINATVYYYIGQSGNCFDTTMQFVAVKDVTLDYDSQAEICGQQIILTQKVVVHK